MIINRKQVAEMTGLSEYAVSQLAHAGKIPLVSAGADGASKKFFCFDDKAVRAWVKEYKAAGKTVTTADVPSGYMTIVDAAKRLGKAENTITQWALDGRIASIKVGFRRYIVASAVGAAHVVKQNPVPALEAPVVKLPNIAEAKTVLTITRLEQKIDALTESVSRLMAAWGVA